MSCVFSSSYCLPFIDATYDYVVIGSGTSGLAIAARLAATSSVSVALVEAVDWGFVTIPQVGAANRKIHYARDKCLGGTSGRSFMAYHK